MKTDHLKFGDLIVVETDHKLRAGFFVKNTGNSMQYIPLYTIHNYWKVQLDQGIKDFVEGKKKNIVNIYWIAGNYYERIVKITKDCLEPNELARYEELQSLLIQSPQEQFIDI